MTKTKMKSKRNLKIAERCETQTELKDIDIIIESISSIHLLLVSLNSPFNDFTTYKMC